MEIPTYDLLKAMSEGIVAVDAEGRSDGRMTVSVTNNTKRRLRVVLPPGLIAQGTAGQMGGMGGMGGGMGGMGGGMRSVPPRAFPSPRSSPARRVSFRPGS